MKFSVVIPCYNAGHRIEETLDSVAGQTCPPTEVFVIDDGSTDDSKFRVTRHSLSATLLESDRKGPAGARNVGLLNSTGEAIAFIDADDMWREDHLENAAKMLASESTVACVSNSTLFFENLEKHVARKNSYPLTELRDDLTHDEFVSFLLTTGHFCQPSVVVKREYAAEGFDESLFGTEDIEFFMRIIFGNRWGYNPEPTVIYRADTPGSVSKNLVRQSLNAIKASKKSHELGYQSQEMTTLLARDARKAIAAALTYGTAQDIDAAWGVSSPYLARPDFVRLCVATAFRIPFKTFNHWRLSQIARGKNRMIETLPRLDRR